jgi:LysR family transcriptional activator of nhaA
MIADVALGIKRTLDLPQINPACAASRRGVANPRSFRIRMLGVGFPVLNFNHVYYFHVAASEGSVARAAEQLGVTQPTVSEQIRQLEKTLGVSLFDRTTTGLRLTHAGRQAYEHTTAMFRAGARLIEALGPGDGSIPATLRVGISAAVSRSVATDFLMPVLRFDECVPSMQTGDLADLVRSLRAHDLDLVIGEAEPGGPAARGLEVRPLHRPRLVAVASPSLELADDWNGAPLIHYRPSTAYRFEVDDYLADEELKPRIVAEADDALLMLEAAARGAGVAFVPRAVARDAIAAGRVQAVATLEPGSAAVYALFHDEASAELARRAVDKLIDAAQQLEA